VKIRFLQTTPSERLDFPFQAGQIIEVPRLTAQLREWIAREHAVVVEDEPEAAVLGAPAEVAALPGGKPRGRR
jgi:hypothetical protein